MDINAHAIEQNDREAADEERMLLELMRTRNKLPLRPVPRGCAIVPPEGGQAGHIQAAGLCRGDSQGKLLP